MSQAMPPHWLRRLKHLGEGLATGMELGPNYLKVQQVHPGTANATRNSGRHPGLYPTATQEITLKDDVFQDQMSQEAVVIVLRTNG